MSDKVVIYTDRDFQGASKELDLGEYDIDNLGIGNDQLSSLKVPVGLEVILYEHAGFQGRTKIFTSSAEWVGDDFNDLTSSLKVEKIPSQTLTVHEYPNQVGTLTRKPKIRVEELNLGTDLVADIRELINQVNIRRIIVKTEDGYILFDLPLPVGVVGAAVGVSLFPEIAVLASFGALAAHVLITRLKIVVEREE